MSLGNYLIYIVIMSVSAAISLSFSAVSWGGEQSPGTRIRIDPQSLPAPFATPVESNPSREIARPSPPPFRLPEGFAVNVFADGLAHARWMTVAPNGDVLLAEPGAGKITRLRDADGDGAAETIVPYAEGFKGRHGLAIEGDWLYVADIERVWRVRWDPAAAEAPGVKEPVTATGALGQGVGHWTRNLVFSPDGSRFHVTVGSRSNIGRDPEVHATVQTFNADGSGQSTYAEGLRNPVGIAFYPGTADLYVVVNERDGLGDGLVPDYLTRLAPGGFYGWPDAYIGPNPQPDFDADPERVAAALVPDLLFRSHSAPLGLVFYDGGHFPPDYRGDAFVALHGSWNASKPTGYMVVRVKFENGRPLGYYETFLSGFWSEGTGTARVWGRPAGLAIAKDGSLLVADDLGQTIWRVSYRPTASP